MDGKYDMAVFSCCTGSVLVPALQAWYTSTVAAQNKNYQIDYSKQLPSHSLL